jgi:hypothetical protein
MSHAVPLATTVGGTLSASSTRRWLTRPTCGRGLILGAPRSSRPRCRWRSCLGLGTLGLGIRGELTKDVRSEENLVSSLSAGQDLSRFSAALGPADTKRPTGTYLIYQFQRRRETPQAGVNRVGVVVSYAVYTETPDFHPSFDHGADVRVNATTVDGGTASAGLAAMGYCAAHKAGYVEASGGTTASGSR